MLMLIYYSVHGIEVQALPGHTGPDTQAVQGIQGVLHVEGKVGLDSSPRDRHFKRKGLKIQPMLHPAVLTLSTQGEWLHLSLVLKVFIQHLCTVTDWINLCCGRHVSSTKLFPSPAWVVLPSLTQAVHGALIPHTTHTHTHTWGMACWGATQTTWYVCDWPLPGVWGRNVGLHW